MTGSLDRVKLSAARLWAADRFPYFASGLFALALVATPGLGTFAVDRKWRLYVDPDAVDRWSVPEIGAVLVHELSHLLRDHARRAIEIGVGETQFEEWNIAADCEINDDLLSAGLVFPDTPMTPGLFGWPESALAESYFHLLRRGEREQSAPECGSGTHGRARPWEGADGELPGVGPEEAELVRRRVAADVAAHAKLAGNIPEGWLRWAEVTLRPVVDWRRVLATEIRQGLHRVAGRVDYTFARRSRRAAAAGDVLLPGTFRLAPDLAVVVDTSSSMGTGELARALSEVDGILGRAGLAARRVPVLACDAAVGAITRAARGSDVVLAGGGGTDMGAGIAAAAQLRPRPQVIVVLTDGGTPWPACPPRGISVIVGLIGPDAHETLGSVPHWGRAVVIEEAA
jgi:predicted metal-dependent peptidase